MLQNLLQTGPSLRLALQQRSNQIRGCGVQVIGDRVVASDHAIQRAVHGVGFERRLTDQQREENAAQAPNVDSKTVITTASDFTADLCKIF